MSSQILDTVLPLSSKIIQLLERDREVLAAIQAQPADGADRKVAFGIASSDTAGGEADWLVIRIASKPDDGKVSAQLGPGRQDEARFFLQARPEDWKAFFSSHQDLVRPYQSYWGMLRVLSPQHPEVKIIGDISAFGQYARLWRVVLDRIRDVITSLSASPLATDIPLPPGEETAEDAITGKYIWTTHSTYGKVKIFYETSGTGPQILLFLHTAGSDSRQYHSLMNQPTLLRTSTMYAFDLPAHGRSSLGTAQLPESYTLTEPAYLESIAAVISALSLARNNNLILCGASMAGHICLAAAIAAPTLHVRGVIPLEACAHLPLSQPIYELSGADTSLLDPERVCGMTAPSSPDHFRRQIWWQYSSQGVGVFAGDLRFYFRGWDGRGRVERIDTRYCPVFMLTGEFDYSCTVEASEETARMIPGARFERMEGVGHFPATERPDLLAGYIGRAVEWITERRQES